MEITKTAKLSLMESIDSARERFKEKNGRLLTKEEAIKETSEAVMEVIAKRMAADEA